MAYRRQKPQKTAPRPRTYTVKENGPLLKYLFSLFPEQSRKSVKAYLYNEQVMVNGTVKTAFDEPLWQGDRLEILPKGVTLTGEIKSEAKDICRERGVEILYEDNNLIVVDKKAGLPVTSTTGSRHENTVFNILQNYVKTKARAERRNLGLPSHARMFVVHRLDRGTSGLLIMAKDEATRDALQSGWNKNVLLREYTGLVEGRITPPEGRIVSFLTENEKTLKMSSSDTDDGGLKAVTNYHTEKTVPSPRDLKGLVPVYTLVTFSLETGRKNQIRVQCESKGNPIAGDRKYSAKTNPIGRLALHASRLSFIHPVTGQTLEFESKAPKAFTRL